MNKDKQIEETIKTVEEIASQVCKYHDLHSNGKSCLTCWRRTENCNKYPILLHLAESNYRKASDVARDIFEEISKLVNYSADEAKMRADKETNVLLRSQLIGQQIGANLMLYKFAELKKKYTKSENNNE